MDINAGKQISNAFTWTITWMDIRIVYYLSYIRQRWAEDKGEKEEELSQ